MYNNSSDTYSLQSGQTILTEMNKALKNLSKQVFKAEQACCDVIKRKSQSYSSMLMSFHQ